MSTTLDIDVRDMTTFLETGREWEDLERRLPSATVVRSWAWTRTWLEHYGDLMDPHFVLLRSQGKLVGATLLCRARHHHRGPLRIRTLHLGCSGEPAADSVCTPRNGMLVAPGHERAAALALLEVARADPGWDELRLEGLTAADAGVLRGADPALDAHWEVTRARDLLAVRRAGGCVSDVLPRKQRYELRRTETSIGAVSGRLAATRKEARTMLDELIELHTARWERDGQPGAFASERFTAFHRGLLDALPLSSLVLLRTQARNRTVGCVYGFVEGRTVLMYQGGFAAFDDPRVKPGIVTHVRCMQAATHRGLDAYDLLAGDSTYKRELTDTQGVELTLRATRRRARLAPVDVARRMRGRVRA